MSRPRPITAGRARPTNLAVSMREAFTALNDLVLVRLAERGHGDIRAAHGVVFQYLDETGTTVSVLAERAQITKQAMAELVIYLEAHGYVSRQPDPRRPPRQARPAHRARPGGGRHRPGSGAATRGSDHRGSRRRTSRGPT